MSIPEKEDAADERSDESIEVAPVPVEPEDVEPDDVGHLKQQAVIDLRRQKQLAGAAFAAVVAFLALVYLPGVTTLARLHERLDLDGRQLRTDRERSSALPDMRLSSARLERDLEGLPDFPAQPPLDELMRETTQLGLQLHLRGLRYQPQDQVREGNLGVLPVRLTLEGNFENVYSFISRCEQMPWPVRVQELHVRQKPAQQGGTPPAGDVTVEMKLNVYFQASLAAAS